MKKHSLLIILICACALLLVLYLALSHSRDSNEDSVTTAPNSETSPFLLLEIDASNASRVEVIRDDSVRAFYEGEKGLWYSSDMPHIPLDSSRVLSMLNRLSKIYAYISVSKNASLADYELDSPSTVIKITVGNKATELKFGLSESIRYNAYYFTYNSLNEVFLVPKEYADALDLSVTELASVDTLPKMNDITSVEITSFSGKSTVYSSGDDENEFSQAVIKAFSTLKLSSVAGYGNDDLQKLGFSSPASAKISYTVTETHSVGEMGEEVTTTHSRDAIFVFGYAENDGYYIKVLEIFGEEPTLYIYDFDAEGIEELITALNAK